MANKRMFSSAVLESDAFLDLPPKSQNLYVHLNMRADDDGFASPKSVMRSAGCTALDLKHLVDANFVILFDSGVVCITDWKENNTIKADRYKPTQYQKELSCLGVEVKTKRYYVMSFNSSAALSEPKWNQNGSRLEPQYRLVESSEVKERKDKRNVEPHSAANAASDGSNKREKVDIFLNFANGDAELLTALREFNQMRNRMKKPMTDRAKQMLCNKLNEKFQPCEWVAILEQSVYRNWSDIYPLSNDKPVPSTNDEDNKTQLDRILNDLKAKNRGVEQ